MMYLILGSLGYDATSLVWPKAGGSLHNTNFQAMGGDYSGGFVEIYRTDCSFLDPSISNTSTYTQFAIADITGVAR